MAAAACGAPSAEGTTPAAPDAERPEEDANVAADEPEPCRVFVLVREPTVKTSPIANVVAHGDKPGSLVTLVREGSKELLATTLGELETSICERLEPKPYLLHLFKENDTVVGKLSTPTEVADAARDARTICDAERLGATILPQGTAAEQRSIGIQQSAGGLTSAKYRTLLFDLMHHSQPDAAEQFIRELDHDIHEQGEKPWRDCTLLVKK